MIKGKITEILMKEKFHSYLIQNTVCCSSQIVNRYLFTKAKSLMFHQNAPLTFEVSFYCFP